MPGRAAPLDRQAAESWVRKLNSATYVMKGTRERTAARCDAQKAGKTKQERFVLLALFSAKRCKLSR